ncbi:unnamed protein product [Allacma fusca]|uniref:Uncharacterized protein n=1 Tax=Allacma fusca TaxID=39272 RepID=A0A8J2KMP6_9HEXA|nr:unnamed protein product [Allacma fusca]
MAKADKNILFGVALALTITICQCHLASVVQSSGEGRSPYTNFVDRVSRGPSIRSNEDEPDMSSMHVRPGLKSPAFQYRLLPNKNSQLYHNAPGPLSLAQLSPFHIQSPTDPATSASEDHDKTSERNNDSLDQEEAPTFTPFIGARALSNMGKFFEHLRENLVAMQQEGSGEIGQPERRRLTSGEVEEGTDSGPEISSSGNYI